MTFQEMRKVLDPGIPKGSRSVFIDFCTAVDGRMRVGGPKGKGRLTAKRALQMLGAA